MGLGLEPCAPYIELRAKLRQIELSCGCVSFLKVCLEKLRVEADRREDWWQKGLTSYLLVTGEKDKVVVSQKS